jgi:hypothetical protein
MNPIISTERVFSLPCFEGLRLLRQYSASKPNLNTEELISLVEKVESDGVSLDLEASVHLATIVEDDCPLEGGVFYQFCIKAVLLKHQPIWSKAMKSGRKRFVQTLDKNDQDVFAAAGLMTDPPEQDVITWWDDVSGHARLIMDQRKMKQGRAAEILTLEYERKRLEKLGIDKELKWPGLDDNFAGYDVLSFDLINTDLVNKMIEVKSTTASPLRFFVSRNEWEQASLAPDFYIFHVWDMTKTPEILYIRTASDVAHHIPSDNEKGKWTSAIIPIGT